MSQCLSTSSSTYGVAIASSASHLWLCTPGGVWRGDRRGSTVDLTEDVVALTVREEPLGGGAVIRLRNDHGNYGSIGEGALGPLRLGSTVSVSPGYETAAGREVSSGPSFSIEGFEHSSLGGGAELAIHAPQRVAGAGVVAGEASVHVGSGRMRPCPPSCGPCWPGQGCRHPLPARAPRPPH